MFTISIVGNGVSSACRISYNSLIVGHGRNCQNISFCILDPIQLTVCIKMILGLSCISNGVFLTWFRHSTVRIQALKFTVSIILKCGIGTIRKNYLIVTHCRNHNLTDINVKVPANTKWTFFIAHRIISTDKFRCHTGGYYAQIRKRFSIVTSRYAHTFTNFPTFSIQCIIWFIIFSKPRSKPIVLFCKII